MPVEMAPPTSFSNLPQIQGTENPNALQGLQVGQQLNLQRQMAPMQVQGAQLQLQQQQMDMQDQANMRRAWMDSGGDLDRMQTLATKYGVGPKTMIAMNQSILAQKTAMSTLTKDQLGNLTEKNNMVKPVIDNILAEKDDANLPNAWAAGEQALISRGILKPGEAQPYPGSREAIQSYSNTLVAHDQLAKDQTAGAAAGRAGAMTSEAATAATREGAELPGQKAAAAVAQRASASQFLSGIAPGPQARGSYDQARDSYIQGGGDPIAFPPSAAAFDETGAWKPGMQGIVQRSGMTSEQRTQADQAAANAAKQIPGRDVPLPADVEAQHVKIARESRPALQTAVPGLGGGPGPDASKLTGEEYLNTLPPGTAAQVRAINEGRAVMPSGSTRSQAAIQIRNAVFQAYPGYSDQASQVRKAFTTGPDGRNIGALNTATVHLDQLSDAATALKTGDAQLINRAMNALKTSFGAAAPTNFEALKNAVAGELASALKGNATDPEIANVARSIQAANSPAQLSGVVETNLHVLGAKLSTYQQRYQQQIPGDQAWNPILPAARGVFQKHGFDPTAAAGNQGGGNQGGAQTPKFNVGDSVMYQGRAHKVTSIDPQSGKLTLAP